MTHEFKKFVQISEWRISKVTSHKWNNFRFICNDYGIFKVTASQNSFYIGYWMAWNMEFANQRNSTTNALTMKEIVLTAKINDSTRNQTQDSTIYQIYNTSVNFNGGMY